MALDVKVKIELSKVIGKLGFGYPLIMKASVAEGETVVPYTECANLDEVKAAGFDEKTEVYNAARLMFSQENVPAKVAVCSSSDDAATTIAALVDKGWRQLVVVGSPALAEVKEIADYIETTNKLYFATVSELDTTFESGTYDRTVVFVHATVDAVAALVGEAAGRDAGSFTYKNLILKGIPAEDYTDAEISAIHDKGGITFVTKAGDNVTTEGKALSGEYIDVTDCIDYVIQQIEYRLQKVLNNSAKVPYDNRGIALLESAVLTVLQDAFNNGIIAATDDGAGDYSVSFATRSETSEDDRVARYYPYGNFKFALAGAIHTVEVTGEITY